jgi:hypothetical protein
VVLGATQPFNALVETFTPGATLFFQVDLSTNVDTGGIPDAFAFSILDSGGGSIPTLGPSGADTLLTVNIDSATPLISAYGTDPSRLTNASRVQFNAGSTDRDSSKFDRRLIMRAHQQGQDRAKPARKAGVQKTHPSCATTYCPVRQPRLALGARKVVPDAVAGALHLGDRQLMMSMRTR